MDRIYLLSQIEYFNVKDDMVGWVAVKYFYPTSQLFIFKCAENETKLAGKSI